MTTPHCCDEHCVCPDHDTQLYWAPSQNLHACQRPDCRFAQGLESHPDHEPWPGHRLPPRPLATHDATRHADMQAVWPAVFLGRTPPWLTGDPC